MAFAAGSHRHAKDAMQRVNVQVSRWQYSNPRRNPIISLVLRGACTRMQGADLTALHAGFTSASPRQGSWARQAGASKPAKLQVQGQRGSRPSRTSGAARVCRLPLLPSAPGAAWPPTAPSPGLPEVSAQGIMVTQCPPGSSPALYFAGQDKGGTLQGTPSSSSQPCHKAFDDPSDKQQVTEVLWPAPLASA